MNLLKFFLTLSLVFFILAPNTFASENEFITIVNPVRIAPYTQNPKDSINTEYYEIKKRDLPASWLLTYDVLAKDDLMPLFTSMDTKQDLGIFLEVTPDLARAAGVKYNQTDSWYRANSIFLSGYSQGDRRNLIDAVFNKFRERFNSFPTSVGAWWVDSYSLGYMKKKYNIMANLGVADQFSTDGYQIWGQYFSVPFYPSKYHTSIPARTIETKLDITTLQWAPRDPVRGYGSGRESLYSTQDYFTIGLGSEYFEKLVKLYAKSHSNSFGQVTIGLEGDFKGATYAGIFADQLTIAKNLSEKEGFRITNMKQFSDWYRQHFPGLSPPHLVESKDLLGEQRKALWYQSPSFRIGFKSEDQKLKIIDFRYYNSDFEEPFNVSKNEQLNLLTTTPSLIDSAQNIDEAWEIGQGDLTWEKNSNNEVLIKAGGDLKAKLTGDSTLFYDQTENVPKLIKLAPFIKKDYKGNVLKLTFLPKWIVPTEGYLFRELTPEATYFISQRKVKLGTVSLAFIFFTFAALLIKKRHKHKFIIPSIFLSILLIGFLIWYNKNSQKYYVSQAEIEALYRLSSLPQGKVIVFDRDCLQCSWSTPYQPAVFANKRNYVKTFAKKQLVYNLSIFNSKDRKRVKMELNRLKAKYIYVVKIEGYNELVPFSPGDLNIEKIYENANAQVWRVE